jgi:hypothetical protein
MSTVLHTWTRFDIALASISQYGNSDLPSWLRGEFDDDDEDINSYIGFSWLQGLSAPCKHETGHVGVDRDARTHGRTKCG